MKKARVRIVDIGASNLVLRWNDPETGMLRQKSARTPSRKEATRQAGELEADINSGRVVNRQRIPWDAFRDRHDAERLPGLKNQASCNAVLNHLERICKPNYAEDVTGAAISRLAAVLRSESKREATIRGYISHLIPVLAWGKRVGLLAVVPDVELPRQPRGRRMMKGRPISGGEFRRMLRVVRHVRPGDAKEWRRLLWLLWLSGLRLAEAVELSWDAGSVISVDCEGRYVRLRIWAEGEKGFRDRLLPIAPDFARWLLKTPEAERVGPVCSLMSLNDGQRLQADRVGKVVRSIGRFAKVVVDPRTGKTASAHDLRRSFGTRWASKVRAPDLQQLMRHESIETTLRYYIGQDADEISERLHGAVE